MAEPKMRIALKNSGHVVSVYDKTAEIEINGQTIKIEYANMAELEKKVSEIVRPKTSSEGDEKNAQSSGNVLDLIEQITKNEPNKNIETPTNLVLLKKQKSDSEQLLRPILPDTRNTLQKMRYLPMPTLEVPKKEELTEEYASLQIAVSVPLMRNISSIVSNVRDATSEETYRFIIFAHETVSKQMTYIEAVKYERAVSNGFPIEIYSEMQRVLDEIANALSSMSQYFSDSEFKAKENLKKISESMNRMLSAYQSLSDRCSERIKYLRDEEEAKREEANKSIFSNILGFFKNEK